MARTQRQRSFNKTFHFSAHLQVLLIVNRKIRKNETLWITAAPECFMMELQTKQPKAEAQLKEVMFNTRYYDAIKLIDSAGQAGI